MIILNPKESPQIMRSTGYPKSGTLLFLKFNVFRSVNATHLPKNDLEVLSFPFLQHSFSFADFEKSVFTFNLIVSGVDSFHQRD